MDKEKECVLTRSLFNKYWNILKRNYNDKIHTQEDANIYYSIFKDLEKQTFIKTIELVLKKQKYFPNIAEMYQYVEVAEKKLNFQIISEGIEAKAISEQEQKELEKLMEKFKNN